MYVGVENKTVSGCGHDDTRTHGLHTLVRAHEGPARLITRCGHLVAGFNTHGQILIGVPRVREVNECESHTRVAAAARGRTHHSSLTLGLGLRGTRGEFSRLSRARGRSSVRNRVRILKKKKEIKQKT